ncbi:MAG: hypothetical protein II629_03910 [Ruminococcus sp.]|nr:hypothetical protein [Ruminococcus sp.]
MSKNRLTPPQKGSNFIQRIQQKIDAEYNRKKMFTVAFLLQAGADAFILASHDVFGLGAGRARAALDAYKKWIDKLMTALIEDAEGDRDLTYFWADLDSGLKQIVGADNFTPKEQRYDDTGEKFFYELFLCYVKSLKQKAEAIDAVSKEDNPNA